jgi:hypothetical protein
MMEDIPKEIKMLEGLVELRLSKTDDSLVNNNINHIPWEILTLNKLRTFSICNDIMTKMETPARRRITKRRNLSRS